MMVQGLVTYSLVHLCARFGEVWFLVSAEVRGVCWWWWGIGSSSIGASFEMLLCC